MTHHAHAEYVEGCFRCDLSREENPHNHITRDIKGDGSCPGCDEILFGTASSRPCWVNEDCIAGYHMDEIECRFPTWQDEAAEMGWMEAETLRRLQRARAEGWAEGYLRGTLDATSDLEPADNPYEARQ